MRCGNTSGTATPLIHGAVSSRYLIASLSIRMMEWLRKAQVPSSQDVFPLLERTGAALLEQFGRRAFRSESPKFPLHWQPNPANPWPDATLEA